MYVCIHLCVDVYTHACVWHVFVCVCVVSVCVHMCMCLCVCTCMVFVYTIFQCKHLFAVVVVVTWRLAGRILRVGAGTGWSGEVCVTVI